MEIIDSVTTGANEIQSNALSEFRITDLGSWMSLAYWVLIGLFLVILLWKMLRGYIKGARVQLLSTCMLFIAIVASMFLTKMVSKFLLDKISFDSIKNIVEIVVGTGKKGSVLLGILEGLPIETVRYVISIPFAVILSPIFFLIVFGVVRLVLLKVQSVIKTVFRVGAPKSSLERIAGLCVAAVEAVMVFSIITLPLTSIGSFADEIISTFVPTVNVSVELNSTEKSDETEEVAEGDVAEGEAVESESKTKDFGTVYRTQIRPALIANPVLNLANGAVNSTVVSTISKIAPDGERSLRDEFVEIVELLVVDVPEFKSINFATPSEEERAIVTALIEKLTNNGIVTTIVSETASATAKIMTSDALGFKLQPPMDAVVDDVLLMMSTCTKDSFKSDLYLIRDIYFLLADEEVLVNVKDSDLLLAALTAKREGEDKNTVQKIVDLINKNERTKPLVTTLTKLSITMLASQLDNSGFVSEDTYDNLKSTMTEVLAVKNNDFSSRDEYMEALSATLDENFRENGIEIEKEIVDNIAEYIDEKYPKATSLTDEQFNDVLLSYFDAYIEYKENGTVPDDLLPPGGNTSEPGGGKDETADNEGGILDKDNIDPDGWTKVGYEVGNACPTTSLEIVDGRGKTISIGDLRGKVVVIHFWTTLSEYCQIDLANFNKLANKDPENVAVILVHSVRGSSDVSAYIKKTFPNTSITFTYDTPLTEDVGSYYDSLGGNGAYPRTLVLNKNGIVTFVEDGLLSYEAISKEVDRARRS